MEKEQPFSYHEFQAFTLTIELAEQRVEFVKNTIKDYSHYCRYRCHLGEKAIRLQ